MKKIYARLNNVDVISFDIFDTLVNRIVDEPSDVFELVERFFNKKYQKKILNFRKNRIFAEELARKNAEFEEITLEEIYKHLPSDFSEKHKKILMDLEREIEIDVCVPNFEIHKIFDYAISLGKKVIITSDMYLEKEIIEKILIKCNYINYDEIFLSSEIKKTKRSGNLFKYILNKMNISANKCLHIGDNRKADFLQPLKLGIRVKLISNHSNLNNKLPLDDSVLAKFLKLSDKNNVYEYIGYNCIGPILYGFSSYLERELKKNGHTRLFFLSRDGKIMKEAFDIICPNVDSNYLYASRRAIIVPTLSKYSNTQDMLKNFKLRKFESIQSILKRLGIDMEEKEIINVLRRKNINLNPTEKVNSSLFINEEVYKRSLELFKNEIYINSIEEAKNYNRYLKDMGFNGNIAIVDIGWFGNMQKAIETLTVEKSIDVTGYYMGNRNENFNSKMKGYLFSDSKNIDIKEKIKLIVGLFELFFTTNHGSVLKIIYKNNIAVPLLDKFEYESNQEWEILELIQKSALQFVRDFHSFKISSVIDYSVKQATQPLFKIFLSPTLDNAERFGNLKFYDNGHHYIARHQQGSNLIKEIKDSPWRIGFMKRVLKIPLPYEKIEVYVRKRLISKEQKK